MSMTEKNTVNIDYSGSDELTEVLQDGKPGDVIITKIKHRIRRNDDGNMAGDIIGIVLEDGSTPVTKKGATIGGGGNTSPTLSGEKEFEEAK